MLFDWLHRAEMSDDFYNSELVMIDDEVQAWETAWTPQLQKCKFMSDDTPEYVNMHWVWWKTHVGEVSLQKNNKMATVKHEEKKV
jgi:hypothetical protein